MGSEMCIRDSLGTLSHYEEVMVGVEHWLMARWKARVEYLLSVLVLVLLPLAVEELQGRMSKLAAFRRGRSLGAKI